MNQNVKRCLSLKVCRSLYFCLSVSVCNSLSVCLSVSASLLSLTVCLYVCLSLSLSLCLCLSLSLSLSISFPPPSPSSLLCFSELQWMFFFVHVIKLNSAVASLWEVEFGRKEVGGSGRLSLSVCLCLSLSLSLNLFPPPPPPHSPSSLLCFSELQWMFFFVQVIKLNSAVASLWEIEFGREEVDGTGRRPLRTRPIEDNKQFWKKREIQSFWELWCLFVVVVVVVVLASI